MTNLKDKTCLVIDYGFFAPLAERLAREFGKVYYYCALKTGYRRKIESLPGYGVPGVIAIDDWYKVKDEIDLFVFPDCYDAGLQEDLKSQGCLVWGAGQTNWLEQCREDLKIWMISEDMPTAPYRIVEEIEQLKEKIQPDEFIKISEFRGDFETMRHYDLIRSDQRFDSLKVALGPAKDIQRFLLEKKVEGKEVGYDGFTVNGKLPKRSFFGYEIKDKSYAGMVKKYSDLPNSLKFVTDKMCKVFQEENTKSFFSNEVRITKQRKPFLIDPTLRCGNPPYQLFLENIKNLGEILWFGSQGILKEPEFEFTWGVIAIMNSAFAEDNSLAFKIDPKVERFIKIMNLCMFDGVRYSVPLYGLDEVGAVVGLGNSLKEAKEHCIKNAEGVKADSLDIDISALDEAEETIKDGENYGIYFN